MQGIIFMQLLLLAVILLLGSGGAQRPQFTSEVTEILKYISDGNSEVENVIKQVEQVSEIVNAFAPLVNSMAGAPSAGGAQSPASDCAPDGVSLPLKPIANIADDSIYNALSKAIA